MAIIDLVPAPYRLAARLAGLAAVMAAGAAAWNFTPLVGPHAHIARLGGVIDKQKADLATAKRQHDADAQAITDRDAAIRANGAGAAGEAADTANFWRGQCRAAFEAGYASRSCQAAPGGAAGGPGGPSADDRVRHDLRTLWASGAYAGGPPATGGVPAKPQGPDRR